MDQGEGRQAVPQPGAVGDDVPGGGEAAVGDDPPDGGRQGRSAAIITVAAPRERPSSTRGTWPPSRPSMYRAQVRTSCRSFTRR